MSFDSEDDLMADVAAAVRGDSIPGDEGIGAPAVADAPAPAPSSDAPAAAAPSRDPAGRFAPKTGDAAPAPVQAAPAIASSDGAQADSAARPPASWSAPAKAAFNALPPIVQQEIVRREGDFDKGRRDFEAKAELANRFDALFASRKDRLAMAGMDSIQAVQRLLAAQDILDRDPRAGILALAQAYGLQPAQIFAQAHGQQQPQQAQLPPELSAVMQRIGTLEQTLTQQSQSREAQERAQHSQSIQQFAADPSNLYFENVKGDMAALLASGRASTLQDAYDMATWSSPEIRPLLLRQQQADQLAAAQATASAKVSKARSAGASVTGSPAPGASPAQQSNPNASIEDDVRAAFAVAGSRA